MFESDFLTTAASSQEQYQRLIAQTAQIVCDSLPDPPYVGTNAQALASLIDSDFLPNSGRSPEHFAKTLRTVVANSVNLTHPNTAAHLHCPPLLAALAAEVVISALNQSMDSFDESPIATVVEQKMTRWLCGEVGFPSTADGTFTTGGSQSNYLGLLLARDAFCKKQWNWSVQKSGLPPEARRFRIFCSDVAHFTVEKSASQLGLGADAVVKIAVDDRFQMNPKALQDALETIRAQDLLPLAIVATAGTTDFGSVDPLPALADLAHSADAWLHVDAAYGGALFFSARHREKLRGIETADSLTIDFHKLFWQPIPCSAFLLRDTQHFEAIRLYADYLNPELHEDQHIPNLVTTSLLTTRRFDALKLWISFQTLGREKLAAMIDRTITLAEHVARAIRASSQLQLICDPQLGTVVFRYMPSRKELDVDQINFTLRQQLFDRGLAIIGHTRVHGQQCLKFTCMNPTVTENQIEKLIGMVIAMGLEVEG